MNRKRPEVSARQFCESFDKLCHRPIFDHSVILEWCSKPFNPHDDTVFVVGEIFRFFGLPTDGLSALYGAGRYLEVAQLLRELSLADKLKAVQLFCRLPHYLEWIEECSEPRDNRKSMHPGPSASISINQLRTDRITLFDYETLNAKWKTIVESNRDSRNAPPRFKDDEKHVPVYLDEAEAWLTATQAITGIQASFTRDRDQQVTLGDAQSQAEHDFALRRYGHDHFNEMRERLWWAMRPWAEILVGEETLCQTEITPIRHPGIARALFYKAIRQAPELRDRVIRDLNDVEMDRCSPASESAEPLVPTEAYYLDLPDEPLLDDDEPTEERYSELWRLKAEELSAQVKVEFRPSSSLGNR